MRDKNVLFRCSLKEVEADLSALESAGESGSKIMSTQACIDLAGELKQLKQRHRVAFQTMNKTERRMVEVRNILHESLYKRRKDVEDILCNSDQVELSARASTAKEERDNAVHTRTQLREDLDKADKGMSEAVARRLKLDKWGEKRRVDLDKTTLAYDEVKSELAKKEAKLSTLMEASNEATAFQGTVPGEEIEKVKDWSHSRLVKEAKKADRALKKFKGVNTMATEEFNRLEEALAK